MDRASSLDDQANVAAPAAERAPLVRRPIAVRLNVESFIVKSFMRFKIFRADNGDWKAKRKFHAVGANWAITPT